MGISWKVLLLIVGISTLTLRALLDSNFATSTLVYVAIPFLISIALAFFTKHSENQSWIMRYLNHLRIATIVFLATSAFLFEGFICVAMFMPIYYAFVTVGFAFAALLDKKEDDPSNTFKAYSLPVLVLVLASEGFIPATTVDRVGTATFVAESPLSPAQLQANMARPITFGSERHWFMRLFPLPDKIMAETLNEGDIHKLHFTYNRWFFTNTHKGEMHIKMVKVSDHHIRTQIVRNDSYLANYMRIDGTDIRFMLKPEGGTRVALSVRYERQLDPAWYFGSMQHFAAEQSAKLFLSDIIFRHEAVEATYGS